MEFSAKNLCRVLCDRSLWPEGFVWNYAEPSCCAIGLSRCIFNVRAYSSSMGKLLGISDEAAHHIFIGATSYMLRNKRGFFMHRDVTPEHIACLIEEFCGIEPPRPVSFTIGADPDSEHWDNRRKIVEPAKVEG